jgi:hypothetical protein
MHRSLLFGAEEKGRREALGEQLYSLEQALQVQE